MTAKATANCNFSQLGGDDPHADRGERYREYRARWENQPAKFKPGTYPVHLDLEATSLCNLKCTFCDKLPVLKPSQMGNMDFGLYTKIIDEGVANGLCSIKLSYRGEPLLHPRLADMVSYAKERGILDIYFNTNGMLLTEEKSAALIDAGLDRISISVEGTDPDAFEQARVGANFERIRQNIARLMELRRVRGTDYPNIRCQTVVLPGIDLQEYANYWQPYCDETAAIDFKDAEDEKPQELVRTDWACPQPWQRMTIEWDGTMHPCNNDDQGKAVLGNACEMPVAKAWRSEMANNLRANHQCGKSHEVEACAVCPWRQTQILKLLAR